jgi:hypothetical protein
VYILRKDYDKEAVSMYNGMDGLRLPESRYRRSNWEATISCNYMLAFADFRMGSLNMTYSCSEGKKSCGLEAPLSNCNRTGSEGDR